MAARTERHRPWRPGTRVARLRAAHSYRSVLGLVVVTFLVAVAAPDDRATRVVLTIVLCATLLLTLWTSGLGQDFAPGLALIALGVVAVSANIVWGGSTAAGLLWLADIGLVLAIIAAVALGVLDQGVVNEQSILGAICIYIALGMLFTFAYGAAAALGSGPFFAQGTDGTLPIRVYFSFVTLATLGYGDFTPASNLGRSLAVTEALLGQLYLVTVLALLVSRLRSTGRDDRSHVREESR
jgi:Ion channel